MKRVKVSVSYAVPDWNFCDFESGQLCRFCDKTKNGYACRLYDENLSSCNDMIYKARKCCEATAGFDAEVTVEAPPAPAPTIDPKVIMSETIKIYTKALNELLTQGYPRLLAEKLAKQSVLGGS